MGSGKLQRAGRWSRWLGSPVGNWAKRSSKRGKVVAESLETRLMLAANEAIVAVLDTGVNGTDPVLVNNMWLNTKESLTVTGDRDLNGYANDVYGWNFVMGSNNTSDMSINNHGTNVAKVVLQQAKTLQSVYGIAGTVKIMPVVVMTDMSPLGATSPGAGSGIWTFNATTGTGVWTQTTTGGATWTWNGPGTIAGPTSRAIGQWTLSLPGPYISTTGTWPNSVTANNWVYNAATNNWSYQAGTAPTTQQSTNTGLVTISDTGIPWSWTGPTPTSSSNIGVWTWSGSGAAPGSWVAGGFNQPSDGPGMGTWFWSSAAQTWTWNSTATTGPTSSGAGNAMGLPATIQNLVNGINYVIREKTVGGFNVVAMNIAMGGWYTNNWSSDPVMWSLKNAIDSATSKGIIVTIGAGNGGNNNDTFANFPANASNSLLLSTAATDSTGNLATFTNFGIQTVDLAAPGSNITVGGTVVDGTEFAAADVAGTAAAISLANGKANGQGVVNAILNSADHLTGLTNFVKNGNFLNADAALQTYIGATRPTGFVDSFTNTSISGWAFDRNLGAGAVTLKIYIDNQLTATIPAGDYRIDLQSYLGSTNHGFTYNIPVLSAGNHLVQVIMNDFYGTNPTVQLGAKVVNGSIPPIGSVDVVNDQQVVGWAFQQRTGAAPVTVRIDVDGVAGTPFPANQTRADLQTFLGSTDHGFVFTMPSALPAGQHRVDVYFYDALTNTPLLFNSYTVIRNQTVLLNVASASATQIHGWAYDPDDASLPVSVRVVIDNGQTSSSLLTADELWPGLITTGTGNDNHGFTYTIPYLSNGTHQIDIYASDINTGASTLLYTRYVVGNQPAFGFIDVANSQQIVGWAYDYDAANSGANPIKVRVDIDGQMGQAFEASISRSDLQPIYGSSNHGFAFSMPQLKEGSHTVKVWALDATTSEPILLGTRAVVIAPSGSGNRLPTGFVDLMSTLYVRGWAYDANAASTPINVRVDVDGQPGTMVLANGSRPDLPGAAGIIGNNHGYNVHLPALSAGAHRVDVYAFDDASNMPVLLGSGFVNPNPATGAINTANGSGIVGWAYEAVAMDSTRVRLDIDGRPGNVFTVDQVRLDVTATYGFQTPNSVFGFKLATPPLTPGVHNVRLNAIETGTERVVLIAGKDFTIGTPPTGYVDVFTDTAIQGWAYDADAPATSLKMVIAVDGVDGASITANQQRNDLQPVLGSTNHGFYYTFQNTVGKGQHRIDVKVIDPLTGESVILASRLITFN